MGSCSVGNYRLSTPAVASGGGGGWRAAKLLRNNIASAELPPCSASCRIWGRSCARRISAFEDSDLLEFCEVVVLLEVLDFVDLVDLSVLLVPLLVPMLATDTSVDWVSSSASTSAGLMTVRLLSKLVRVTSSVSTLIAMLSMLNSLSILSRSKISLSCGESTVFVTTFQTAPSDLSIASSLKCLYTLFASRACFSLCVRCSLLNMTAHIRKGISDDTIALASSSLSRWKVNMHAPGWKL